MANTLSVMIRNVVSKKRRRYTEEGFNLDLAYICDNIIAMGYPGEYIQSVFRNPMNDVCHFFEVKHQGHYKVYNLRSEKAYDVNKFHGRVSVYAFEDHNPPTIELIDKFCNDIDLWLNADPNNVAAIHCKAGKGRTGTMICCYLLYSGIKTTAEDALAYYGEKRTMNKKGVTIPSQRRYVQYYAKLIRSKLKYERRKLQLCEIRFSPATTLQSQGSVQCLISTMEEIDCTETRTSKVHDIDSAGSWTKVTVKELVKFPIDFRKTFTLDLADQYVFVTGDVKVELKKLFHFWFNSYFVCDTAAYEGEGEDMKLIYTLPKWELDDAHKDKEHKLFSEDFEVQLVLKPVPADSRIIIDGSDITQLRQHNNHNNHVNSLTHDSYENANKLLTHQLNHSAAIPTSSKSGDSTSDSYFIQYPVERSRKPTSLPPYAPIGSGGGIAGGSSHGPLNNFQSSLQGHHQQKRSSEPTPSGIPESINRSNNKNHNNSSHHHQQHQQQHPHHHHLQHQHHLHHEQQKFLQQQQQLQNQQQLESQQQNNKCSTSSSNINNTSSNSNSSSSSSISTQSSSSSSSDDVGGGGGGGGGGGEEEDWESGESSTTTTCTSTTTTTTTTTTTPTTTSYFSYKRLISSQNDDDDNNSNKNDKHDDDDDNVDGATLISTYSVAKPSTTTSTITTSTTTTINTTSTTTIINNSKSKTSPTAGSVDFLDNTNSYTHPFLIPPLSSSFINAEDDVRMVPITTISSISDFSDSLPLPIPLPPPKSSSSTNGLQPAYASLFIAPMPIKPRHTNFFHKKCNELPCNDSRNQKSSATSKCTTAGSKFLKLINSQRFKAKTISPAMGSSLALNSSGVVSACAVAQNQLLKKKKTKSKTIPPSKTFQWLQSYFRTDPDFHENLSQQTTIPMGRRNSAGSISSRNHLNSVGSASGIGRAGSVEKGFRVGSLESRCVSAEHYKPDTEENSHFVTQHAAVPNNFLDKSSCAIPADNSSAIDDSRIMHKCNFAVEEPISLIRCSGLKKATNDFSLSLGTSPVDKALRNVVDVGTQLSSISPAKHKEFTYESDSDNSMSQSNVAVLLTQNNLRSAQLDALKCFKKSPDVAMGLPRVSLGKSSPPLNERTISIGSSNNSTSMDLLCVPYSNMFLPPQSTLEDGGDTEAYHDHDDYYSSICDNQLSFNNSPCKSPRSLSDILDLKPPITQRILLRQTDGSSPSANVTPNTASAATVASGRKNINNSDGIVIAKPVESHSIGFNVEISSATISSAPQTTEKYNMMDVDCDDIDSSSPSKSMAPNFNSTPTRRKTPDSVLNLIIIKPDHNKLGNIASTPGGSVDAGDDNNCGTGNISPNNPKALGSSSSSSGCCCASEGSQSASSTSSGVVDTISSSGITFSLERNSLDGGGIKSVVVINSKKKLSLPTPEIEVNEIGMTQNRSSSVSNNNNNHSNISPFIASSLSSSSSGSSIDDNDTN